MSGEVTEKNNYFLGSFPPLQCLSFSKPTFTRQKKCVTLMPVHVWQGILCLIHDIGFIKKMRINAELKTATDDTGYPRKD